VLDLRYEARKIDQDLISHDKIDQFFERKTRGMSDLSKAQLRKRWATVQKVTSSEPRIRMIVNDILDDLESKPRLMDGRGNALLVCSSVYQACKFYDLFTQFGLGYDQVAIVTSYVPNASDISKEDSGEGKNEAILKYETYRKMISRYLGESDEDKAVSRIDEFEDSVKERFIKHPGEMRLLIVVDRLLTGFDSPSATYLYIDKKMQDHGLFQAICRVNRLDGDDKEYGYIVDYRDLFRSLEKSVQDYTSEAFEGYDEDDVNGLLKDHLSQAREHLDELLEQVRALCEPVAPPKGMLEYQTYFVSDPPGDAAQIKDNEQKRVALYKSVAALVRAYATIANEMIDEAVGYTEEQAAGIKREVEHFLNVRDVVKLAANEVLNYKQFEAGMRRLLDTYVQASDSEVLAEFEDQGLIQLIVERGKESMAPLPSSVRKNPGAVAATIVNNMRRTFVDERAMNPAYYDKMSALLDAIIEQRRQEAIDYDQYLQALIDHAKTVGAQESESKYPEWAKTRGQRAVVDFFDASELADLAIIVDETVKREKEHNWAGNRMRERALTNALFDVLPADFDRMDDLIDLLKKHDEYR
jgi:type I restriction enzyme R subunit